MGLLVRSCGADALATAAEACSAHFARVFDACAALDSARRDRDQVPGPQRGGGAAALAHTHRRVMPWSPTEPGADWPLALLLRHGASAALAPGAAAAAARALPPFASAFGVELFARSSATVGTMAVAVVHLCHSSCL